MDNNISKVSVALGETEINIVNQVSDERGLYNFSLAVRQIIREWYTMKTIADLPEPEPCKEDEK